MTGRKGRKKIMSRPSSYVLMTAFYVYFYVVVVIYLAVVTPKVKGNVMGVDFGLDFMKVALVAPRKPLEIVTNTASKRKTETVVSFDRGELALGGDAYAMIARKPGQVFSKLHALIGRHASHPSVVSIVKASGLPGVQFNTERRGIDLLLNTKDGKEQRYSPEELVALLLVHAQDITRDYVGGGRNITDVVLTAPIFWGALERQALIDAAHLAGLNPLAIVDETTAAAVQFLIDRPTENDTNILFYNMGAGSVQVSIITLGKKMSKKNNVGQLTVKAKAWDETLGGHWFDVALVDLLAENFNDESIFDNPRAMAKLRAHAGKIKQVLSANVEIPVTIEALHNDKDLVMTVTREMLLRVCNPLIERAILPVTEALAIANMTITDIHGVEVIGGGVRVPALQEALHNYLNNNTCIEEVDRKSPESGSLKEGGDNETMPGLNVGIHLNGDEAMSLGAAFVGANASRSFNVRPVGMVDITPFAVNATVFSLPNQENPGIFGGWLSKKADEMEKEFFKASPLIASGDKIPFKKSFSFVHDRDLVVELMYVEGQAQLPPSARMSEESGGTLMLASYHIAGIDEFAKNMTKKGHGTPRVYVRFSCGTTGIPQIVSAEAQVEYEKNVTYTETIVVPIEEEDSEDATVKNAEGNASNETVLKNNISDDEEDVIKGETANGSAAAMGDEENGKGIDELNGTTTTTNGTNGTIEEINKRPKTTKKFVTKTKLAKQTIKQSLDVTKTYVGMPLRPMTEDEKQKSKSKVRAILEADMWRKEKEAAKNNLETYILHVRGTLRDQEEAFAAVSTPNQINSVLELADELEEWLYEDGLDVETEMYRQKQKKLAAPAEAILFRKSEAEVRPATVAAARLIVSRIFEKVEEWEKTKPHITESERQDAIEKGEEILLWLDKNEARQADLECHEDPVFTSEQIDPKLRPLKSLIVKLAGKPLPKKEKTKKTVKNGTAQGNNTENQEEMEDDGGINEEDDQSERKVEEPQQRQPGSTEERDGGEDEVKLPPREKEITPEDNNNAEQQQQQNPIGEEGPFRRPRMHEQDGEL